MKIIYIFEIWKKALKNRPFIRKDGFDRVTTLLRFPLTEKTSVSK